MSSAPRVPTSTYRLQITEDFDLVAAAGVLPYLHDLGADWVYLSPILAAEADSAASPSAPPRDSSIRSWATTS